MARYCVEFHGEIEIEADCALEVECLAASECRPDNCRASELGAIGEVNEDE